MLLNIEKLKNNFLSNLKLSIPNKKNTSKQLCSFAFNIEDCYLPLSIDALQEKKHKYFYWNLSSENEEFLGFFPLMEVSEPITNGIEFSNSDLESLQADFFSNWNKFNLTNIPLVVGGIKFASDKKSDVWKDFNDSDWFIPSITILKLDGKCYLIYNFFSSEETEIELLNEFETKLNRLASLSSANNTKATNTSKIISKSFNSQNNWNKMVNLGLDKIQKDELEKIVLSKEVKIHLNNKPMVSSLIDKLNVKYPKCYCFAYGKNESVFLGASPEKFVKFNNNNIEVDALAGSVKRGVNEEEDLLLEKFLLESKKNLNEQQAVVTFIKNLLVTISDEIIFNEQPTIRKLPNIQHLSTPIKARLKKGCTLFDVLKILNPTPAICGTPWSVAHKSILELESHDRGLYSGNLGWFNFNGYGEFAVAIRSALIKGKTLFAYAGCGIVKGSEPQQEFEESEIKLKPILSLFVDEKIYQS